jgi:hypothetical protein
MLTISANRSKAGSSRGKPVAGVILYGVMAATVGSPQSYTPNIQGGGATLPAPTYRQDFNCFGMPLTSPPDPTSDTYVPPECCTEPESRRSPSTTSAPC